MRSDECTDKRTNERTMLKKKKKSSNERVRMRACERETDARKRYFEEFSTLNNGMEILFIVDTLLLGERITRTMKRQKNRKRKRQKETCIKDYLLNK